MGGNTVRVNTFQKVGPVVMEALTNLLAQDPEAVARDAMVANQAFSAGVVQHSLNAYGRWQMSVTVHDEQVPIVVVRNRWW